MPDEYSLTDLEQILLLAALRLGDDAVGADIQTEVEKHAHRVVSIGSIHVTLSRLEGRGFVESGQTEPRAVRGGKARRSYTVTKEGKAALAWNRRVMDTLWKRVPAEERA